LLLTAAIDASAAHGSMYMLLLLMHSNNYCHQIAIIIGAKLSSRKLSFVIAKVSLFGENLLLP